MEWAAGLFDISLQAANRLYAWGWGLSVSGAVITMLGVGMLWMGTRIRDHDFDSQMAGLNLEAANAREGAGKLEERAAGLENETAKAKERTAELERDLEVEKTNRRARQLTKEQIAIFADFLRGKLAKIYIMPENAMEPIMFAAQIAMAIRDAGVEPVLLPAHFGLTWPGIRIFSSEIKAFPDALTNPVVGVFLKAGFLPAWGPFPIELPLDAPVILVGGRPPDFGPGVPPKEK